MAKPKAVPDKTTHCDEHGVTTTLVHYQTGKKKGRVRCVRFGFDKPTHMSEMGGPIVNAYRILGAAKHA